MGYRAVFVGVEAAAGGKDRHGFYNKPGQECDCLSRRGTAHIQGGKQEPEDTIAQT